MLEVEQPSEYGSCESALVVRAVLSSRPGGDAPAKGEAETLILDHVYTSLPTLPFPDDKKLIAANVYAHVWQQAVSGASKDVAMKNNGMTPRRHPKQKFDGTPGKRVQNLLN